MCRKIRTLFNFDPPATEAEIRDAALQFVRKLSGLNAPSKANRDAFDTAVDQVAGAGPARQARGRVRPVARGGGHGPHRDGTGEAAAPSPSADTLSVCDGSIGGARAPPRSRPLQSPRRVASGPWLAAPAALENLLTRRG